MQNKVAMYSRPSQRILTSSSRHQGQRKRPEREPVRLLLGGLQLEDCVLSHGCGSFEWLNILTSRLADSGMPARRPVSSHCHTPRRCLTAIAVRHGYNSITLPPPAPRRLTPSQSSMDLCGQGY